jgi:hypothetical protein
MAERTGILRCSLLTAGLCLCFVAPGLADPAQTAIPATMRRLPSVKAHIVQHIPANAEIDVSSCAGGWCYGSWRNLFGYIPARAVEAGPPVAMGPPPFAVAPPVVGPAFGWGGPYAGASWGYGWRRW